MAQFAGLGDVMGNVIYAVLNILYKIFKLLFDIITKGLSTVIITAGSFLSRLILTLYRLIHR